MDYRCERGIADIHGVDVVQQIVVTGTDKVQFFRDMEFAQLDVAGFDVERVVGQNLIRRNGGGNRKEVGMLVGLRTDAPGAGLHRTRQDEGCQKEIDFFHVALFLLLDKYLTK